MYTIVVENVGTVYSKNDDRAGRSWERNDAARCAAEDAYYKFVGLSACNIGRMGGEVVTLFHDGEMLLSTDSDSQWVVTIGDNERGETPMSFGPFFSKLAAMEYREGLDDESEWAVTQLYRPDYN
ncbi:MAG: hypothetical protein IPG34_19620 [Rhodocyclaceae bacterium]|nr:hypothetical protein [Rhodocyclaceae bacterium]